MRVVLSEPEYPSAGCQRKHVTESNNHIAESFPLPPYLWNVICVESCEV